MHSTPNLEGKKRDKAIEKQSEYASFSEINKGIYYDLVEKPTGERIKRQPTKTVWGFENGHRTCKAVDNLDAPPYYIDVLSGGVAGSWMAKGDKAVTLKFIGGFKHVFYVLPFSEPLFKTYIATYLDIFDEIKAGKSKAEYEKTVAAMSLSKELR